MQNKRYTWRGRNKGLLITWLLILLFIPPGLAQQSDAVPPPANVLPVTTDQKSASGSLPEATPEKSSDKKPKRSPTTQFTPTEKIPADDAVAFPVDI